MEATPGLLAHEIVVDFIYNSYEHFAGGIFWINCEQPEFISSSIEYIEKVSPVKYFALTKSKVSPHTEVAENKISAHIYICDSTWEKGPFRVFFQNRVIATVAKSRL